jgi:hypothetical protein
VAATSEPTDSFVLRFSELTDASPARPRDATLRALDLVLSAFFLLVTLPLTIPIGIATLLVSGRPLLYRGERVGRGGCVFHMLKFRTLKPNAEDRLGPYLGEELVRRTNDAVGDRRPRRELLPLDLQPRVRLLEQPLVLDDEQRRVADAELIGDRDVLRGARVLCTTRGAAGDSRGCEHGDGDARDQPRQDVLFNRARLTVVVP